MKFCTETTGVSGQLVPLIYLIGTDEGELARIRPLLNHPAALAGVSVDDWNAELSPWPAPGLRSGEDFSGGADATLKTLFDEIMPAAENALEKDGTCISGRIIAGYSLGGLCAMYAATRSDAFCAVASVSGSMWYDGFIDYLRANLPQVRAAYLSLGDSEPKARNRRLAAVGETTLAARDILAASSIRSTFEWNPGNHFVDPDKRMAKALNWLLENL